MEQIEAANRQALERMLSGTPVLIDVVPAHEAIPNLRDKMILHAGPPIGWERMCGPMRGAIAGIAVFEGWATDLAEAERMAARRRVRLPSQPSFRCRRPDDRDDDAQPAGAGGGEPDLRKQGVLRGQRRASARSCGSAATTRKYWIGCAGCATLSGPRWAERSVIWEACH